MRIAVVTPYYKEADQVLMQCHNSVLDQTIACDHFLIADGFPNPVVKNWKAKRFELPSAHGDVGNMPRVIGSISAFNQGYDAVAFLDADNWYQPDHLERMANLHRISGATVCTASRTMHRLDGSYMFDDDKSDGCSHVDTNCLFLTRTALPIIARWGLIPKGLADIGDTIYWGSIKTSKISHAHEMIPTVCYRTSWESDYNRIGECFPPGSKSLEVTNKPFYWFKALPAAERRQIWKDLGWPCNTRSVAALHASYVLSKLQKVIRSCAPA